MVCDPKEIHHNGTVTGPMKYMQRTSGFTLLLKKPQFCRLMPIKEANFGDMKYHWDKILRPSLILITLLVLA